MKKLIILSALILSTVFVFAQTGNFTSSVTIAGTGSFSNRTLQLRSSSTQSIRATNDLYTYVDGGLVLDFARGSWASNRNLQIRGFGGTEVMRVQGIDGRVGMGTTSPIAQLDVRGSNIFLGASSSSTSKFAAMGQSGGGAGVTACNLWGFSAQLSNGNNLNMGIRSDSAPVINWSNTSRKLQIRQGVSGTSCGTLVASFGSGFFKDDDNNTPNVRINGIGLTNGGMWQYVNENARVQEAPITDALNKLMTLEGVSHGYASTTANEKSLPKGTSYSFNVSTLEEAIPHAVITDSEGFKAVNYDAVLPLVTEAMKVQQELIDGQAEVIDELTSLVSKLEARLNALEGNTSERASAVESISLDGSSVVLSQNRPNPANDYTTFAYEIPETATAATLVVYDVFGKIIKNFDLTAAKGNVEFNTSNLTNGTYVYAIVVDGQKVATKKMTIQK